MKTNDQPIEKLRKKHDGNELDVHSVFHTIQGEGPFTGHPAVFVRLAGCNLQCPGCDTDYTQGRQDASVQRIVDSVRFAHSCHPCKLVVITGGEPFRQNITPLCNALLEVGYDVQIESNGTLPPSPDLPEPVVVICSPKTGAINPAMAERMDALKYVMDHRMVGDDGLPELALNHTAKPRVARPPKGFTGEIYLQPMDCQDRDINGLNIRAVRDSCLEHGYTLQLQIHKLIGVE